MPPITNACSTGHAGTIEDVDPRRAQPHLVPSGCWICLPCLFHNHTQASLSALSLGRVS